jgi:MFS transporter, NRE family, putaive nickel resistance protein
MGSHFPTHHFFYGGLIGFALLITVHLALNPGRRFEFNHGLWHEHEHRHDKQHQHQHLPNIITQESHTHLHFHAEH